MPSAVDYDVDELLREFFRRELAHPWPPLRLPAPEPQPKSLRRRGLWRRYASLAASIGFLLIGLALASQMLRSTGSSPVVIPHNALPGKAEKPDKRYQKPATTPDKPPAPDERKSFTSPLSAMPR